MLELKKDFPIYSNHPDLVYLDSAATAQKPRVVLDAMNNYYQNLSTNVARGLYPLAEKTTAAVDEARMTIASFIDADERNVIFVPGATAGINLVTTGLREQVKTMHNIVVTEIEHHSNFLPWKELAAKCGAEFRIAPMNQEGLLDPETLAKEVDEKTFALAFTAVSNVLGLINPVADIIKAVHKKNPSTLILVDACQAVGHVPISLKDWGADYIVFSGHKLFGPTGIGVLAGTEKSLSLLGPVNVGGGTVLNPVSTPPLYKGLPERLEGGTPNIAGIIGLGAAIAYIEDIGVSAIREHERALIELTLTRLTETFGESVIIIGPTDSNMRTGILSFTLDGVHPHDIAQILGEENVCVRAGEHCAMPLHRSLDIPASARVSLSVYNDASDIERLETALKKARSLFL
jgi:cysteine desulfurase / selenocysteine lyase